MHLLKVSCFHHCYMLPSLHWCIYFFINPSLYFSTLFLCSTYDASIPAFLLLPSLMTSRFLWFVYPCCDGSIYVLALHALHWRLYLCFHISTHDLTLISLFWCSPFFFVVSALPDMLLFLLRCHVYCTLSVPTYMLLSQLVTFIDDLSQSWFSINIWSSLLHCNTVTLSFILLPQP